jgi:hypothetical protein
LRSFEDHRNGAYPSLSPLHAPHRFASFTPSSLRETWPHRQYQPFVASLLGKNSSGQLRKRPPPNEPATFYQRGGWRRTRYLARIAHSVRLLCFVVFRDSVDLFSPVAVRSPDLERMSDPQRRKNAWSSLQVWVVAMLFVDSIGFFDLERIKIHTPTWPGPSYASLYGYSHVDVTTLYFSLRSCLRRSTLFWLPRMAISV